MTSELPNKFSRFKQLSMYRIRTELDASVNKLKHSAFKHWLEAVIKAKASISDPNFKRENYTSFDDYYKTELQHKFTIDHINEQFDWIFREESYEMWEVEVKSNWNSYCEEMSEMKLAEVREFWRYQYIYNDKTKQFENDLFEVLDQKNTHGLDSRNLGELFDKTFIASANRFVEKRNKLVNDNR